MLVLLLFYVKCMPHADVLAIGEGVHIWPQILEDDEGVFQFTQVVEVLHLVCDVQIYLDLLQAGLRGPDQANALRGWEGFRL